MAFADVQDITLDCPDGVTIAAQRWTSADLGGPPPKKILCIHGWLDNCRSFHRLAPYLVENFADGQVDVVAIDLPGHGLSSHKSLDGPIIVQSEFVYYISEAVNQLGWTKFSLIGHSLGSSVGCLYAAAFPEYIDDLVLLENVGPRASEDASLIGKDIRNHVKRRMMSNKPKSRSRSLAMPYPDFDTAVEVRQATAAAFPGAQYISKESSEELVRRSTKPIKEGSKEVEFVHDPRLKWPSIQYFTTEQVDGIYSALQSCRICILLGKDGMPYTEEQRGNVRNKMNPNTLETLPGSHHFHMDNDHADEVAKAVFTFLNE